MAGVEWKRSKGAPGVYERTDSNGRRRYRAVAWVADPDRPGKRKQVTETFDLLTDAKRYRSDYTSTTPKKARSKSAKTLQKAYEDLHAEVEYAPATVKLHDELWSALKKADRSLVGKKLHDIEAPMLRAALKKIGAVAMRNKARQLVGLIYRREEITPNPAVKEHTPRTRASRMNGDDAPERYLDEGAVNALVGAMSERYRFLVWFLANTGLRPGEAFALTVGQWDPESRVLTIDRATNGGVTGPTKTGAVRHPVLPAYVADRLNAHIKDGPGFFRPDALVFTSDRGKVIELHNWRQRHWATAVERAGLDGVSPYALRHTALTNMVHAGVNLAAVAEMAGHSVEVLARTYLHFTEKAGRDAADLLDAVHAKEAAE